MTTRSILTTLAALTLLSGLATNAAGPVDFDPVQYEVERARELHRAVVSHQILLQGDGATKELVNAALHDVERYVEELDNRYATSQLFLKDAQALDEIKTLVAKAHFECALLHARGVDLEGSIVHYERVIDLLGYAPATWNVSVERAGRPGLLPNAAEAAYELASPAEVEQDLKLFWSAGVVARFRVREYGPAQLPTLRLERVAGSSDAFSDAAFDLANPRFQQRVARGLEEFRVVLPPGRYRVSSTDQSLAPLEFQLTAGTDPDPITLNPNRFNFVFASTDERCRPTLTLNGLMLRSLERLPYGTFRLEAPKTCTQRLPERVAVDQSAEITLRTEPEKLDYLKEGQPIFVFITTPPDSTYTLRM